MRHTQIAGWNSFEADRCLDRDDQFRTITKSARKKDGLCHGQTAHGSVNQIFGLCKINELTTALAL